MRLLRTEAGSGFELWVQCNTDFSCCCNPVKVSVKLSVIYLANNDENGEDDDGDEEEADPDANEPHAQ